MYSWRLSLEKVITLLFLKTTVTGGWGVSGKGEREAERCNSAFVHHWLHLYNGRSLCVRHYTHPQLSLCNNTFTPYLFFFEVIDWFKKGRVFKVTSSNPPNNTSWTNSCPNKSSLLLSFGPRGDHQWISHPGVPRICFSLQNLLILYKTP